MDNTGRYPGTARHQALARALVSQYENDPRVLAVVLFGSLARGNWDEYSDLDCDIVVADGAALDVGLELSLLGESFARAGEEVAFSIRSGDDAGDIQFRSLLQLSIRYHPLPDTSPNIIGHMTVLAGSIDQEVIQRAGAANQGPSAGSLTEMLDEFVRYAVVASACIQRDQVWTTIEILHRMRAILMNLFTRCHGGERWYQFFDIHAPQEVKAELAKALPSGSKSALRAAWSTLLDTLETKLETFAAGQVELTDAHRAVLGRLRQDATPSRTGD